MKSRKLLKEKSIALLILGLGIVFLSAFGPALGLRSLISALFYRRLVGILLGTIIVVTALVVIRPLWLKIPLENSLIKSGVVISLGLSGIYCSFAVKAIFPSVGIIACFAFVVSSLLKEQEFSRSNSIRRQLLRTDIAILIYASLIAIIIVTVRTAFGFLDTIPSESLGEIIPKFWYTDDPVLAVYNKEHVRLAVLQFFLFTALAFFAGNAAVRFFSKFWSRLEGLHPATAIFAIVLFFGSISLPSFDIDAPHWTVWLGPALDALSGNWPYLHAQSGYGFLVSGVIGAWISLFAVSSLSLASLVFLATIIAGI
ncbi:MAG TPA: hypothetical protein PLC52_09580 [Anaerolineales bacterium]|nr:hypothetical protein [Anaerolineales bacterium]HRQ93100.1 hypothetical protein [Anaerolineales bacterium]